MNYHFLKTKISILLLSFLAGSLTVMPAKAEQQVCQIEEERTLFSDPAGNINKKIQLVMKSANLEGEIEEILWAEGYQIYSRDKNTAKIFAPSASLFPVTSLDDNTYLFSQDEIGYHYKLETPAWEYDGKRFTAKKKKEINGAEKGDAPWLVVETNQEGYSILRIETRGGIAPDCSFDGLMGVPYQTLYVVIKNDPVASK